MVKKIRKVAGGRKKELQQPDEVMSALQDTYNVIDEHKKLIIGAIALMIAIILATSGYMSWQEKQTTTRNESFSKVFELIEREVATPEPVEAEESDNPDEEALPEANEDPAVAEDSFASETAKYEAITEKVAEFIASENAADMLQAARLIEVSANMKLGKNEVALESLRSFTEEYPGSSLGSVVLENMGVLNMRLGQFEAARKQFETMKEVSAIPYYRARAMIHLGDMLNPVLGSGNGDAKDLKKARALYQEALELLPEADPASLMALYASDPKNEVKLRLLLTPSS